MAQWLKLGFIVLLLLFSKIVLVFLLSNLFGLRGIAGIHFFNWIRLLLIVSGALSLILFIYFISRGQNEEVYVMMLSVIIAAMVAVVHAAHVVGVVPSQFAPVLLFAAVVVALHFSYMIARTALGVPMGLAIPIVILDLLISMTVWALVDRLV